MKIKCTKCNGSGRVRIPRKCPACQGLGATQFLSDGKIKESNKCPKCNGSGKSIVEEDCNGCTGSGYIQMCDLCDKVLADSQYRLCPSCYNNPIVFELNPPVTEENILPYRAYIGKVTKVTDTTIYIDLKGDFYGTAGKPPKGAPDVGTEVIAKVMGKASQSNRYDLYMISPTNYKIQALRSEQPRMTIVAAIEQGMGNKVYLHAQIVKIIQTSGPTAFTFIDESGTQLDGIAFKSPGERCYPEIDVSNIVNVFGKLNLHKGKLQLDIEEMTLSSEEKSKTLQTAITDVLNKKATATQETPFLVENETLKALRPVIQDVAIRVRRAIFSGQKIWIRHHADADGVAGGIALEEALLSLLEDEGIPVEGRRNIVRRVMNRNPSYDLSDCSRDLEYALQEQTKFNQPLPLFICLDFGSSIENMDSFEMLKAYNAELIVIDHHPLENTIKDNTTFMVNPYSAKPDLSLTSGMLAVEIAQIIQPKIIDKIKHLPVVAGFGDVVKKTEMSNYIKIIDSNLYTNDILNKMAQAIDFECFHLRYLDGNELFRDILALNQTKRDNVRDLLAVKAMQAFNSAVEASMKNLTFEIQTDNALIARIDVDKFSQHYSYPPASKITGGIHTSLIDSNPNKQVITLGDSSDMCVLRSSRVELNFPEIVKTLQKELPEGGITGGGHEIVGTVRFFEGKKDIVMKRLLELLKSTLK